MHVIIVSTAETDTKMSVAESGLLKRVYSSPSTNLNQKDKGVISL